MKIIKIGILPQEKMRERVLSIARGEIKTKPRDPKVWFTSMRSLALVHSDENRQKLDVISTSQSESITALSELTARKQGNLTRTLKTMSRYGLVKMERMHRSVRPVVQAQRFEITA